MNVHSLNADLIAAAQAAESKSPGGGSGVKYAQELSRSLTFKETILITLSAVTPASSVFIIVPSVVKGIGGASAIAFAIAAVIGVVVAFCYAAAIFSRMDPKQRRTGGPRIRV